MLVNKRIVQHIYKNYCIKNISSELDFNIESLAVNGNQITKFTKIINKILGAIFLNINLSNRKEDYQQNLFNFIKHSIIYIYLYLKILF